MYRTVEAAYFSKKYDGIFDDLPIEYVDMYEEMDIILHRYSSLQWNHRDDLKAFSLMFRNVDIDNCSIVDKAFFLNRANDIIGYKNIIYSAKASDRERIVRYYYEYDSLFELFANSFFYDSIHLNTIVPQKYWKFTIENFQVLSTKEYNHVFSVVDLTDQQCITLIQNISELEEASTINKYIINVLPKYDNLKCFIREIVLPYIWGDIITHRECFQKFANFHCDIAQLNFFSENQYKRGKELYNIINDHCRNYTNEQIETLRKKQYELEKPSRELFSLRNNPIISISIESPMPRPLVHVWALPGFTEHERDVLMRKEIDEKWELKEKQEKEQKKAKGIAELKRKKQIEELESLIKLNKPQLDAICHEISQIRVNEYNNAIKEYDIFIEDLTTQLAFDDSNPWYYMFKHQDVLQKEISSFYINQYIKLKQIQTSDNVLSLMKITKKTICEFVTFMLDSQKKDLLGKKVKRELELSSKEDVCFNIGCAKSWANYLKPILSKKEEKERIIREEEERKRREAEEKRLEQYRFNIRNRHWRDRNVSFRKADHLYIVDGTPLDSVTTFVKNCFPEFDAEFHAKRKAEALGITKEAVLEMWDKKGRESREQGTAMHKKIESYYLGKEPSTDDTFDLFKIFADKITLKPYRTEWAVYDWEQKIAGTIDFVDYQNGEYIIYDWKRSDKLIAKNGLPIKNSQYGEKALPPIENLDDSPYYHYALQLSLYKYILDKNYGITVSKLRLGIFHPSYNKPYVLEMPYLQSEIDTLFGLRSEVIF